MVELRVRTPDLLFGVYTRLIEANTQFDEACAIRPRRADLRQGCPDRTGLCLGAGFSQPFLPMVHADVPERVWWGVLPNPE